MADAPQLTESINPEDAKKAPHSLPVIEAPRTTDGSTTKPRYKSAKQVAKEKTSASYAFRLIRGCVIPPQTESFTTQST